MESRLLMLAGVFVFAILFVTAGMPALRTIKATYTNSTDEGAQFSGDSAADFEGGRTVEIDLSVEDICRNPVTGETQLECASAAACRSTCENKGCLIFGLNYIGSEFNNNRCKCVCHEENKIKKALSAGSD